MIFVSSSCVNNARIADSVRSLAEAGFKNIELSGGTAYYDGYEKDLSILRKEYQLNYRCHNYFPPPKTPFVLNLASGDQSVIDSSLENIFEALELSREYGASKFGFHAGFYLDIYRSELGKKIEKREMNDKTQAKERFYRNFESVKKQAGDVEIYLENNVVSAENFANYGSQNMFMLTSYEDYEEMRKHIDFKVLLDVAHLKVSCNTLGLPFAEQLHKFLAETDYVHVSDNNGLADQNEGIAQSGDLAALLKMEDGRNKDYTLEVYSGLIDIQSTYKFIESISHA